MSTASNPSTTEQVAARFNVLAKEGKWFEIQAELFSNDAFSIEPPTSKGIQSVQGKDAIKKKGEQWAEMVEKVNGGYSNDPIVAGNHFAVAMGMDVTLKDGNNMKMDEVAVYEVKDGKIVKEQFFY
jgi:hypothetical protein